MFLNNYNGYALFLTILIILPFFIIFILDMIKNDYKELKMAVNVAINLSSIIFILSFIICVLYQINEDNGFSIIFNNAFYYYIIIVNFLILNLSIMKNGTYRKYVNFFIESIEILLRKNVILNFFIVLCIWITRNNSNFQTSILCSYIFFLLTKLNELFNTKKNCFETNKKYHPINKFETFIIVILNIAMMYYLAAVEKIFFAIINQYCLIEYNFCLTIILIIVIMVSPYFIEIFSQKKKKY